jgi:hypothetical protein
VSNILSTLNRFWAWVRKVRELNCAQTLRRAASARRRQHKGKHLEVVDQKLHRGDPIGLAA